MIASRGYKRGARQKRRELFLPKEARLFENLRDRYIEQVRVSNFHRVKCWNKFGEMIGRRNFNPRLVAFVELRAQRKITKKCYFKSS